MCVKLKSPSWVKGSAVDYWSFVALLEGFDDVFNVAALCKAYNIKETELYVTGRGYFNEPRNVAVYLIRHLRNDTLKDVGKQFGIEKYSTVSSIALRTGYKI